MKDFEHYLGIANHDILMAHNQNELKSYIAGLMCEYDELQQENAELQKQLHDASIQIQEMIEQDIECPSNCSKLQELKKQQQEFIDYLKRCIKKLEETKVNKLQYTIYLGIVDITKEILTKYKEIIGDVEDEY